MEVYMDNAATSWPKPEAVYEEVENFMRHIGASSGRGAYRRALKADNIVFEARENVADLFNIDDVSRIVFTLNATEAINLAIKGIVQENDHVITSSLEHNAVWRCLKTLEKKKSLKLTVVPSDVQGNFDLEYFKKSITRSTKLVVINHASNVVGTIAPVGEIGAITKKYGVPLLVDSAQAAGNLPIDVEKQEIDLLAFTGHKGMLGPSGTGGLYIREGIELEPLKEGGTGSDSYLEYQPQHLPDKFEAGTLNTAGIAGLAAGARFILDKTVIKKRLQETWLTQYLIDSLNELEGIEIYGPLTADKKVGVVSFNIKGIPAEKLAQRLDCEYNILLRAGLHCAPCAHNVIGTLKRGAVRAGLGAFNDAGEIDYLVNSLEKINCEGF